MNVAIITTIFISVEILDMTISSVPVLDLRNQQHQKVLQCFEKQYTKSPFFL